MKTIAILFLSFFALCNQPNPEKINPNKKERIQLLNKVFQLLENYAANPNWIKSASLQEFKELMYSEKTLNLGETEFIELFKSERHKLNFSHFDLYSKMHSNSLMNTNTEKKTESIYWKEANKNTAYLRVKTFTISAEPMVKAVSEIGTDIYKNLIIDLRGNGGGSLDAAVVLGRFITQNYIDAGVYLTKRWFQKHKRYATKEDIQKMPFLKEFTLAGITKMYAETDAFRMVLPPHKNPIFKGNVYILINNSTASTCEPLIDLIKKNNLATIVGKTSAGNMLTGQTFTIDNNYSVFIPIADYQTADGSRLDQIGVTPHYEVAPNKAFKFVIDELIK